MTSERIRKLSDAALAYTIRDLREVIDVQDQAARDGHYMPKLGQYWDEFHACLAERNRRHGKGMR